jgi:hypothetical protein
LLKNLKYQVLTIARIQNFAINEHLAESIQEAPRTISYLPSEPQDKDGNPILLYGLSNLFPGWMELREEMARNAEKKGGKLK